MKHARVALVAMLALAILATPLAAQAQPAGKIPRIGFLVAGPPMSPEELAKFIPRSPFWLTLKELG